jgi:hypothetical protein
VSRPDNYFSRVYHSIRDDTRLAAVYTDDAALATWLRLLIAADRAWPAPADIPRSVRRPALRKLVDAGVVELLPGDLYRFHGLDAEREMRSQSGRNAAALRWHSEGNAGADAVAMLEREEKRREEKERTPMVNGGTGVRPRSRAASGPVSLGEVMRAAAKDGDA